MRVAGLVFLIAFLAAPSAFAVAVADKADVRVVIDISGSMKRTDPRNLRQPATELLVRLLPGDAQAGIWTFGTDVEVLVPHGAVSERWRQQGLSRAAHIGSTAMRTDIPAALERALAQPGAAGHATSIILLTDGVVDVSADADANAAARRRVLDELAPRLQAARVRVHTVALSDEADQELLAQLSLATDGIFVVADTAEALQKLFVQALDTAAPAEQLPLEGNQFLVDASIDELTALVFHRGEPLVLESPDGTRHSGGTHGEGFRWFAGDGFELITITKPAAGRWQLEADTEAGSRVTIVSNLALTTSRLIQNGFPDQPQRIEAQLQEQGAPLRQPALLALVNVSANVVRLDDDFRWDVPLLSGEPASYAAALPMLVEPGRYEVAVTADGKTFRRSWVQRVTVRDHATVQVGRVPPTSKPQAGDESPAADGAADPLHRIGVTVVNPAIDLAASELAVDGVEVAPRRTATGWLLEVPITAERREIDLQITAVRRGGDSFVIPLQRLVLTGESVSQEAVAAPSAPVPAAAQESTLVEEEPAAPPPPQPSAPAARSWLLYAALGAANLLLIGLIWLVVRTVRGSRTVTPSTPGSEAASGSSTGAPPAAAEPAATVPAASSAVTSTAPVAGAGALDALDLADLDLPLDAIDLDPAADQR